MANMPMTSDDTDYEDQKTVFPKKGPTDNAGSMSMGKAGSKELGEAKLEMISGGPASGQGEGPTGSSRSYPKGSKPNMDAGRMNPMNDRSKLGYATEGVGKGEM